jgi:hypothetical protein
MSETLIPPEFELFPDRYRWSVEECTRMAEEGRLVGRYEILDGEVVRDSHRRPFLYDREAVALRAGRVECGRCPAPHRCPYQPK